MLINRLQKELLNTIGHRGHRGLQPYEIGQARATLKALERRGLVFYICTHLSVCLPRPDPKTHTSWVDAGAQDASFRWVTRQVFREMLEHNPQLLAELLPPGPADEYPDWNGR